MGLLNAGCAGLFMMIVVPPPEDITLLPPLRVEIRASPAPILPQHFMQTNSERRKHKKITPTIIPARLPPSRPFALELTATGKGAAEGSRPTGPTRMYTPGYALLLSEIKEK